MQFGRGRVRAEVGYCVGDKFNPGTGISYYKSRTADLVHRLRTKFGFHDSVPGFCLDHFLKNLCIAAARAEVDWIGHLREYGSEEHLEMPTYQRGFRCRNSGLQCRGLVARNHV